MPAQLGRSHKDAWITGQPDKKPQPGQVNDAVAAQRTRILAQCRDLNTASMTPDPILQFQRLAGNRAVSRVFAGRRDRQSDEQNYVPDSASERNRLPLPLREAAESLSDVPLDDVEVHLHSQEPAKLQALAYAEGRNIYVAPGQEQHLPHEAWHVVQQRLGRVSPSAQINGRKVNDDPVLEREADRMGAATSRNLPSTAVSKETSSTSFSPRAVPQMVGVTMDQVKQAVEQSVGSTSWRSTASDTQQTTDDRPLADGGIVYHVSILISDPGSVHLSYYPVADSEYRSKICHYQSTWNATSRTFGPLSQKLALWKSYSTHLSAMQTNTLVVLGKVENALKGALAKTG